MADGPMPAPIVRVADFRLDLCSGELWKNGGERVLLPDQPFKGRINEVAAHDS